MTYDRPAPSDQSYTVSMAKASIPEGIRNLSISVADAVGNVSTRGVPQGYDYYVDRSGPQLELGGDLYADRSTEVPTGTQRPLTVTARDGSADSRDTQRSGVQQVQIFVGDSLLKSVDQTVSGSNQPLSTTWTPGPGTFVAGQYTVRVVAKDRVGNVQESSFMVHAPKSAGLGASGVPVLIGPDGLLVDLGDDLERSAVGVSGANGNLLVHDVDGPAPPAGNAFGAAYPAVDRWYNSFGDATVTFGLGWTLSAGPNVRLTEVAGDLVTFNAPSAARITFARQPDGTFIASDPEFWDLVATEYGFQVYDLDTGRIYDLDGDGKLIRAINALGANHVYTYAGAAANATLSGITVDQGGSQTTSITTNPTTGHLGGSTTSNGSTTGYGYSSSAELLTNVTGPEARLVGYEYDAAKRLTKRTVDGVSTSITYDTKGRAKTIASGTATATLTYTTPQAERCREDPDAASQTDVAAQTPAGTLTYAYCFDVNGQLVNAYGDDGGRDEDGPEVDLYAASEGTSSYYAAAPTSAILTGDDEASGVKRSTVVTRASAASGSSRVFVLADFEENCSPACPVGTEHAATLDLSSLPEGAHELVAKAFDEAGNQSEEYSYPLVVDRSAPAAPSDLVVGTRSDDGSVDVTWGESSDPTISASVLGSGIDHSEARVSRNGAWSAWSAADESILTITDTAVGETIQVEVRTVDRVGNTSPSSAATGVVANAPVAPAARADFPANCASSNRVVAQRSRNQVADVDHYKEELVVQGVSIGIRCSGSIEGYTLTLDGAFEVRDKGDDDDDHFVQLVPRLPVTHSGNNMTNREIVFSGFNYECKVEDFNRTSGQRNYRVHGTFRVTRPEGTPVERDFGTVGRDMSCPDQAEYDRRGLVAWNELSHRMPVASGDTTRRAASKQLRKNLGAQPYAPRGTKRAWEAHHLIPWNATQARAQRLRLWRCHIHPTSQDNGQYLRGSGLKRTRNGRPNSKYATLRRRHPNLAKRTYHGDTFRNEYYAELNRIFGGTAPNDCTAGIRSVALTALGGLDSSLRLGATFGQPRN
jgi:hypothetical protein